MNQSQLFTPLRIREVEIPNRVVVSPMSQYRARDGFADDWHFAHLARFVLGGAGLVFTEATAVVPDGRSTHGDLGLWSDEHIAPLARIARFIRDEGAVPGIQLAHAGRKAAERRPWHGETPVDAEDAAVRGEQPWQAVGPTDEPYDAGWPAPRALEVSEIADIVDAFSAAAARAHAAGFSCLEVYAAHGFLLHQFYSPLCNTRTDRYGGGFINRVRLCREVARGIRTQWPQDKILAFRLSATDWAPGGWTIDDSVILARQLKEDVVDLIDCSSGGIGGSGPAPRLPLAPGFQAHLAARVRADAALATMAVGFIWEASVAEHLIESGQCDFVALARELLHDPNWALHAAALLEDDSTYSHWKPEFGWWLARREKVMRKLGLRGNRVA